MSIFNQKKETTEDKLARIKERERRFGPRKLFQKKPWIPKDQHIQDKVEQGVPQRHDKDQFAVVERPNPNAVMPSS